MQYDKLITISAAGSRFATQWASQEMLWSAFTERLKTPIRTPETLTEYKSYSKPKQDGIKDVGGFVGGSLRDGLRRNGHAGERHLVTLDADNIAPGETEGVLQAVRCLGCAYAVYSTRKHEGAAPRLRIILPLDAPCTAEEYEPIARKIASCIGIGIFDPTTFEPVRLMYWPSCSTDSVYVFEAGDRPFVSAAGILQMYLDWRNVAEWPEIPGAAKVRERSAKRQGDPRAKTGLLGAFCRRYSIDESIATFLPDTYTAYGDGRYTYTEGSTIGGAVVYDNGQFLYSHHATDPAGGRLCNAFDLVRLHLYRDLDNDAAPDTPVNRLPSYKAMVEFALTDPDVADEVKATRVREVQEAFQAPVGPQVEEGDAEWSKLLKLKENGQYAATIDNIQIILAHDANLKGRIYFDEFSQRIVTDGRRLPWEPVEVCNRRTWKDSDDSGLRWYLERYYGLNGCTQRILDAFALHCQAHVRNEPKEYLEGLTWDGNLRLDTVLVEYLGAADTPYTRAVTRKTLVAAVARIMQPGCKFDTMLVLIGRQGIGKSTFFRLIGRDWYADGLETFEGKEAAELVQGRWIIEAGELNGLNRSEVGSVKQFLSKQVDIYREAYGKRTTEFPRQCIIVGTSNVHGFLRDETGGRRFWPVDLEVQVPVKKVLHGLQAEVDQLWAEAVLWWRLGEPLYLTDDLAKAALQAQETHKEINPKEGVVLDFLGRKIPPNWAVYDLTQRRIFWGSPEAQSREDLVPRDRICAAEVWCECFLYDIGRMQRRDAVEINAILSGADGWERADNPIRFGKAYGQQKGYLFRVEK